MQGASEEMVVLCECGLGDVERVTRVSPCRHGDEPNARVLHQRSDTQQRRTRCPWLEHLLTGEDEYVKSEHRITLTHPVLCFKAREPIDEAVGNLF